jgi:D-alanyl-D-alanine dipeptidase
MKLYTYKYYFLFFSLFVLITSCNSATSFNEIDKDLKHSELQKEKEKTPEKPIYNIDSILAQHDSSWVDLKILLPDAIFDIRYADTSNFMKLKVYDCPACFSRLVVAKALLNAQKELDSLQLVFKFFDCYRPSSAQNALWEKNPDSRYVYPPNLGSKHSRGVALDLTLYDVNLKKELDMGTEFDFFGKEAYWYYQAHSDEVKKNRKLLFDIMKKHNFLTISTEWWHFNYKIQNFNLSDFKWPCD